MRSTSAVPARTVLGLFAALAFAACDGPGPAEVADERPDFAASSGAVLVECPTDSTVSATGIIDALGGILSVDGHSIALPAGAVLVPTEIALTVPASKYMEIDVRANGAEHFQFEGVVTVTLSYARCTRSNIDKSTLSAWYIDSSTKQLLENMHGTDDKTARTVTFGTDHLSGYSIAQ